MRVAPWHDTFRPAGQLQLACDDAVVCNDEAQKGILAFFAASRVLCLDSEKAMIAS